MARLIDADELKNILEVRHEQLEGEYGSLQGAVSGFIKLLDSQPTVEAEPVRHGNWIRNGVFCAKCSECEKNSVDIGKYCSNCGAKLEECENE